MKSFATRVIVALLLVAPVSAFASVAVAANPSIAVTSTSCVGPDSLLAALTKANADPGPDVIEIAPGLQIDAASCGVPGRYDQATRWIATVTESVVIHGNGAVLDGWTIWVTTDGAIPLPQEGPCPSRVGSRDIITGVSKGLIRVGTPGADNSAIAVSIEDLSIRRMAAIATVEAGGSLTLQDLSADRIADPTSCTRPAITSEGGGATLSLVRNHWANVYNWSEVIGLAYAPQISGSGGNGRLAIIDSEFGGVGPAGFIGWDGNVDIESTLMEDTGGIANDSGKRVRIVNSLWAAPAVGGLRPRDRFINRAGGTMRFEATTLLLPSTGLSDCPRPCANIPFIYNASGSVRLSSSAIAINFPSDGSAPILGSGDPSAPSGFDADETTWISPTSSQDAAALREITSTPLLRTGNPGLPLGRVGTSRVRATPLIGTAAAPGRLIEAVARAGCGDANELIGPVSGACIVTDVWGDPRVDLASGRRDTGAVQVSVTTALTVKGTGDQTITVGWTRPRTPDDQVVAGYAILYREAGTSDPYTRIEVAASPRSATLAPPDASLVNGTRYEIVVLVRTCPAAQPACGSPTDGPPSNQVKATPFGSIGTPDVTPTPGDAKVDLTWTEPTTGGHTLAYYALQWRPVGADRWVGAKLIPAGDPRAASVEGLDNGTEYEFRVTAQATNGDNGGGGTAEATPQGGTPPVEPPGVELSMDRSWGERFYPPRFGARIHASISITAASVPVRGPIDVGDIDLDDITCPSLDSIGNQDDFLDMDEELVCTGIHEVTLADMVRGVVETTSVALRGVDRLPDVEQTATIAVAPTYLVLLDRSGSEADRRQAIARSYNAHVRRWAARFAGSPLHLTLFSSLGTQPRIVGRPVGRVPRMAPAALNVGGDSPIYDVIASEIRRMFHSQLSQRITVLIMTDGADNASTVETERSLARLIRIMEANHGWRFLYSGAHLASLAAAVDALRDWSPDATEAAEVIGVTP